MGADMRNSMMAAAAICLALEGCSSRPREFAPATVSAVDQTQLDAAVAQCKQLYFQGKLDSSGRVASGAVAAGAATAVGVAGTAAATSAGLYAGAAVLSATLVALPFVAIGGAVGMAKAKRHRKEKAIQKVMAGCLHDHGYEVASWSRVPKHAQAAAAGVTPTN